MELTVVYTFLILFAGIFTNKRDPRQKLYYVIFSGLILILVSGLRSYYVGTDDTLIYSTFFERDYNKSFEDIWQSELKDPVYYIFIKCISLIFGHDFHIVLIICAIMYVIPVCILIKKESPDPMFSFILLITMGFFFFSMNGIRQSLAMGFLMMAYFPLKDRKLLKFVLLVAMAACFHKTALVFLIAYPMSKMGFNKLSLLCYLGLFIVCLLMGKTVMNYITSSMAEYDQRLQSYEIGRTTLTYSGLIQLLLLTIFPLIYYKKLLAKNRSTNILFQLMFLAIIFQSMAGVIAEMFRIAMYFSVYMIILIPRTISVIPAKNRSMIGVMLLSLLLVYFLFIGAGRIPYKFYWQ